MSKKVVVATHIAPETVKQVDQSAASIGVSRYVWIAQAIAEKLQREEDIISRFEIK